MEDRLQGTKDDVCIEVEDTNSVLLCSFSMVSSSLWPHDCSTPGFPVLHHLLELSQTHIQLVGDAIQTSCPLSSPSPSLYLAQHQSFPMSRLFSSSGQSIGISASASVLPMNIQHWFLLGLTGLISLQTKGLSRVLSKTTVQKHQFFTAQPSRSNSYIHTCPIICGKC